MMLIALRQSDLMGGRKVHSDIRSSAPVMARSSMVKAESAGAGLDVSWMKITMRVVFQSGVFWTITMEAADLMSSGFSRWNMQS